MNTSSPRLREPNGKRLLFIPEAVSLAHVSRLFVLAQAARARGYEVCFACDPRYNKLFGAEAHGFEEIWSIPTDRFQAALRRGTPIYDVATLIRYVRDDLRLLERYKPDAVIGDFRLSLSISARKAQVPYFTVTNGYWSPYAAVEFLVPDMPLVRYLGVGLTQRVFDLIRPLVFALHSRPLNSARRKFGLSPLPGDLRTAYTDADQVLYADLPELVPVNQLPGNHHFIGPVLWSPAIPLPSWWSDIPPGPVIYVNLGSSGQSKLLPAILEALAPLPVAVVAATAGLIIPEQTPPNAFIADFLPGDIASQRASLVICNGGSPAAYQSLSAAVPVLGVASNLDQHLNMALVEKAGAGRLIRAPQASIPVIRDHAEDMLASYSAKHAATRLADCISARPVADRFLSLLPTR